MIRMAWMCPAVLLLVWMAATVVAAQEPIAGTSSETPSTRPQGVRAEAQLWHYGAYLDLSYGLDFNFPSNHLFRNRTTTPRVNELDLNMGMAYVRKDISSQSSWGLEFAAQGGEDAKNFGFHVNQPKVGSSDQLRHFGRANVSYLAPVGRGFTLQAGLFNSLIGYESLYAKDNANYTRPWVGDYTPYLMFGINASYPVNDQLTATLYVINSYFHLSHPNNQPSYGGQIAYKPSARWTLKETIYYGPEQADTSIEFWRLFSDSIAEWKDEALTLAFENQIGTEVLAVPGRPRTFWWGAEFVARWNINGPWSVAVRPEFYWDRNGRLTGFEQFVKAVTSTLEYEVPYWWTNAIFRLEYRFDESTGPGGGFFKNGNFPTGQPMLTPGQHLLFFALLWTFDSP